MIRKLWLAAVLGVALAACQEPDPAAQQRADCANENLAADARAAACSALLAAGEEDHTARATALAHRGAALLAQNDPSAALRDFNAAIELDGANLDAVYGRAKILLASGQIDAAEPLVQRLITGGAHVADAQLYRGRILALRGDRDRAMAAFSASVQADPRHAVSLAERGLLKQRGGDHAGAAEDFAAALRIDGREPTALAGRCWNRVMQGGDDNGPARRDAEQAVDADAQNISALLCLGVVTLRLEDWSAAKTAFDTVLTKEPGNPIALFGRGVARRRSGDGAGSQDMFQASEFDSRVRDTFHDWGVATY